MTSLRYYNDPRIIKLDGRYKFYPKFKYRIDFDTQGMNKWECWHKVTKWCDKSWGKEVEWHAVGGFTQKRVNEHYRTEVAKNKWYRHLFLRSEQDLTMILLVIEH